MQEVERGVVRNAEQQVLDGRQRGRLTSLIRPEDDVNVRVVGRQLKLHVGEASVPEQIKATDTHGLLPFRRDPCRKIAGHLINQTGVVAIDHRSKYGIFGVGTHFVR